LALSGGGYRATAFGLGALRALYDRDLLRHVRVVSGISGGSVLAAMWAYGPSKFQDFDDSVVDLLREGLQTELVRRALSPRAVTRAWGRNIRSFPRRSFSRTEALVSAFAARDFGPKNLSEVTHAGLATIFSATDLATATAIRFGSDVSSGSAYGKIADDVPVADAVAASAAFPLLLPPLVRTYNFEKNGRHFQHQLSMTDGGVYDNLGLLPLMPGRSRAHSDHVYDLDYLIAIDAGRGKVVVKPHRTLLLRLAQSFEIAHTKAQDGARAHINAALEHRDIDGFVHSYIGTPDRRLPLPVADLVPQELVSRYPTNFAGMKAASLNAITIRGEQFVRTLLSAYLPNL
jgi:predicted acylesterase/phospholipase RssA